MPSLACALALTQSVEVGIGILFKIAFSRFVRVRVTDIVTR